MKDLAFIISALVIFSGHGTAFYPQLNSRNPIGSSMTHKDITEYAIIKAAEHFMEDYPKKFPNPAATLTSDGFRTALSQFVDGVIKPDTESYLINAPDVHFQDEHILESNLRLLEQRMNVISALNDADVTSARDLAGQLLHTLQDFYSSSNWVEMGQEFINPDLGVRPLGKVAKSDQETCIDCHECFNNLYPGLLEDRILTSGYIWRPQSIELMIDEAFGRNIVDEVVFIILDSGIFVNDECLLRRMAIVETRFGTSRDTFRSDYFGGIWQVDEDTFEKTKIITPILSDLHRKILSSFGIDWLSVQWTDLRKPFISGLAARLHLSILSEPIPKSLGGQAEYWASYYKPGGEGLFLQAVAIEEKDGDCPAPNLRPIKCAFGGQTAIQNFTSWTIKFGAKGGINKDTEVQALSPHYVYHWEAAFQAEYATVEWLWQLREIRPEREFGEFLGLYSGSSLCFVVDTTGSMSNEIAAVRAATKRITEEYANSPNAPSDYVLVPFNDPEYGPVFQTRDSDEMIRELGTLTADGGGDRPEMAYSGMRLAVLAVRPGSECHVYTDAPAKDEHLQPEVDAIAINRNIQMNFMLTDPTIRSLDAGMRKEGNRKKRSTASIQAEYESYFETAAVSGGYVLLTTSAEIEEASNIVIAGLRTSEVTLFQSESIPATGGAADTYRIPVDGSQSDIVAKVWATSVARVTVSAEYIDISGSTTLEPATSLSNIVLFTLAEPLQAGHIEISVRSTGAYNIVVSASSQIDFNYRTLMSSSGDPVSGEKVTFTFDVTNKEGKSLINVETINLIGTDGSIIDSAPAVPLRKGREYEVTMTIPSQNFRMQMNGVDASGHQVQRMDTSVITPSSTALRISYLNDRGPFLTQDESLTAILTIVNHGPVTTYTVSASDTRGLFDTLSPSRLTISQDSEGTINLQFTAKGRSIFGVISMVTVLVSSTNNDNSLMFRVTEEPKDPDTTPPVAVITNAVGFCNLTRKDKTACEEETWEIAFTASDVESGLLSLRPNRVIPEAVFTADNFTVGTNDDVRGRYSASCCFPTIAIVASDQLGNSARLDVDYAAPATTTNPPTTTTITTTSTSTTSSSTIKVTSTTTANATPSTTTPSTTTTAALDSRYTAVLIIASCTVALLAIVLVGTILLTYKVVTAYKLTKGSDHAPIMKDMS